MSEETQLCAACDERLISSSDRICLACWAETELREDWADTFLFKLKMWQRFHPRGR